MLTYIDVVVLYLIKTLTNQLLNAIHRLPHRYLIVIATQVLVKLIGNYVVNMILCYTCSLA